MKTSPLFLSSLAIGAVTAGPLRQPHNHHGRYPFGHSPSGASGASTGVPSLPFPTLSAPFLNSTRAGPYTAAWSIDPIGTGLASTVSNVAAPTSVVVADFSGASIPTGIVLFSTAPSDPVVFPSFPTNTGVRPHFSTGFVPTGFPTASGSPKPSSSSPSGDPSSAGGVPDDNDDNVSGQSNDDIASSIQYTTATIYSTITFTQTRTSATVLVTSIVPITTAVLPVTAAAVATDAQASSSYLSGEFTFTPTPALSIPFAFLPTGSGSGTISFPRGTVFSTGIVPTGLSFFPSIAAATGNPSTLATSYLKPSLTSTTDTLPTILPTAVPTASPPRPRPHEDPAAFWKRFQAWFAAVSRWFAGQKAKAAEERRE